MAVAKLRMSARLWINGMASMDQSKLRTVGWTSSHKLKAGK
jgi:hypothetical protein